MRFRALISFAAITGALALAGCAGSGAGLDANGRPIGSEGGGGTLTADFQSIQDNVFTPICSVCHAGGAAPQGLRLDATNSYAMIVGVPSTEDSSVLRIKPGEPDNSYLIQKIEGHASVGAQMPFGGPPLSAATIATMRQWVTNGAPPATAAAPPPAFALTTVVPATGDVVLESPARIVVAFSRELDRTRLDAETLRLERTSASGTETTSVIPAMLSSPSANPAALLLAPRQPLPDGTYRVLLGGASGEGVSDISGSRLGGKPDGIVIATFTVERTP
jgi:hypothetical protein